MRILSDKIKERRLELGYSITFVAEQLKVKESIIERYENATARKKFDPKRITQLTRVLQCEPSDIIDFNSDEPYKKLEDERRSMVTFYNGYTYQIANLPKEAQDKLRAYIEQLMQEYCP